MIGQVHGKKIQFLITQLPWLGIAKHIALGPVQVLISPGESFLASAILVHTLAKLLLFVPCSDLLYPSETLLGALHKQSSSFQILESKPSIRFPYENGLLLLVDPRKFLNHPMDGIRMIIFALPSLPKSFSVPFTGLSLYGAPPLSPTQLGGQLVLLGLVP